MINDGGQAFPSSWKEWKKGDEYDCYSEGMSLRDYFAAKAMQGLIRTIQGEVINHNALAERAYEIADAMIEQSKKV